MSFNATSAEKLNLRIRRNNNSSIKKIFNTSLPDLKDEEDNNFNNFGSSLAPL